MAYNHFYVDLALDSDTGTGTPGDPYGRMQYALDNETRSTTDINVMNCKGSGSLAAALSLATFGTPSNSAPLLICGYTATAFDGGRATINDNGHGVLVGGTEDYIGFQDITFVKGSTGSQDYFLNIDNSGACVRCEFDGNGNATAGTLVHVDNYYLFVDCYFHDFTGTTVVNANTSHFRGCTFDVAPSSFVIDNVTGCVSGCKFLLPASSGASAIDLTDNAIIRGNTIVCQGGGTGAGIAIISGADPLEITDNHIEGFSGAGGRGFGAHSNATLKVFGGNSTHDCTTDNEWATTGEVWHDLGDHHFALASSPLTDAPNLDFTPSGDLVDGALPTFTLDGGADTTKRDIGAVQSGGSGGGSGGGGGDQGLGVGQLAGGLCSQP